jgi:hypothetical protein
MVIVAIIIHPTPLRKNVARLEWTTAWGAQTICMCDDEA